MTIIQILIIVFFVLLFAIIKRGRDSFLLFASALTIFWLQPTLPIRGFDFWIPILTLIITIFSWFITSDNTFNRKNFFTLVAIASIVLVINATRYFSFAQIFTPSRPPQIEISFIIFFGFWTRTFSLKEKSLLFLKVRLNPAPRNFSYFKNSCARLMAEF